MWGLESNLDRAARDRVELHGRRLRDLARRLCERDILYIMFYIIYIYIILYIMHYTLYAGCRVQSSDLQGDGLAGVGARIVLDAHREDVLSAGHEARLVHHEDRKATGRSEVVGAGRALGGQRLERHLSAGLLDGCEP